MAEQKTPRLSKRMKTVLGKVDRNKFYPVDDALKLVKETAVAKFDESVDVAVNLGVDARKSDQQVRGATTLPHGAGKTVRVAVFTQGPKAEEARAAGADIVGMEDLAEKVKAGNLDFDVVIASDGTGHGTVVDDGVERTVRVDERTDRSVRAAWNRPAASVAAMAA